MKEIVYPTPEDIIEENIFVISSIKAKKADQSKLLNSGRLFGIITGCRELEGDIYDKGTYLLIELIKKHPFASGNRRTALMAAKEFLSTNKTIYGFKDDPNQVRMLIGIREGFYTFNEIKEWLKNGKIKEFKR